MFSQILLYLPTISSKMATFHPVVLSGPSGSGKSTLVKMLMAEYKTCFSFSVSHTTRNPRPGEEHGKDYHFVSMDQMRAAIESGEFLEHTDFSGNLYGTSKKSVNDVISTGKICILDVEIQGVKNIKKTDLNPRYIFVKPPNDRVLEQRLRGRGTESEDSLRKRLQTAREALEYAKERGAYDHIIVNDDQEVAYSMLKGILMEDISEIAKARFKAY